MTEEQTKVVNKYLRKFARMEKMIDNEDVPDEEYAHHRADTILLEAIDELGSPELRKAWERIREKVGGFFYG